MLQKNCDLERQVLKNSLHLAYVKPDLFALKIIKTRAYMVKINGEIIYLLKCTPVEVQILHTDKCFDQLPVIRKNKTWFLTLRQRIFLQNLDSKLIAIILFQLCIK